MELVVANKEIFELLKHEYDESHGFDVSDTWCNKCIEFVDDKSPGTLTTVKSYDDTGKA